jgi:hypothetical protein
MKPMTKLQADDFYEDMMRPDAPDEMAFQIDREKPEDPPQMTFSQEAINELAEQFRMFLMARTYGRVQKTGLGPRHLRATVTLDWAPGDPHVDTGVGPYYQIRGDDGLIPIDSERREYTWRKP